MCQGAFRSAIARPDLRPQATVDLRSRLLQIYFAILIYSYAIHLRKGSYRALPRTTKVAATHGQYVALNGHAARGGYPDTLAEDAELDAEDGADGDDFYRVPAPTHAAALVHDTLGTASKPPPPRTPASGSSITSFADFVSAPGRGRRARTQGAGAEAGPSGTGGAASSGPGLAMPTPKAAYAHTPKGGHFDDLAEEDEVLFDSDEPERGGARSSRSSKFGGARTEEDTSISSREGRDLEDGGGFGVGTGPRARTVVV